VSLQLVPTTLPPPAAAAPPFSMPQLQQANSQQLQLHAAKESPQALHPQAIFSALTPAGKRGLPVPDLSAYVVTRSRRTALRDAASTILAHAPEGIPMPQVRAQFSSLFAATVESVRNAMGVMVTEFTYPGRNSALYPKYGVGTADDSPGMSQLYSHHTVAELRSGSITTLFSLVNRLRPERTSAQPIVKGDLRWVPSHTLPSCQGCGVRFTLMLRRHHCRGCGTVLCAECTPYKSKDMARLCASCNSLSRGTVLRLNDPNDVSGLIEAIAAGDATEVEKRLLSGQSVTMVDDSTDGITPLHVAVGFVGQTLQRRAREIATTRLDVLKRIRPALTSSVTLLSSARVTGIAGNGFAGPSAGTGARTGKGAEKTGKPPSASPLGSFVLGINNAISHVAPGHGSGSAGNAISSRRPSLSSLPASGADHPLTHGLHGHTHTATYLHGHSNHSGGGSSASTLSSLQNTPVFGSVASSPIPHEQGMKGQRAAIASDPNSHASSPNHHASSSPPPVAGQFQRSPLGQGQLSVAPTSTLLVPFASAQAHLGSPRHACPQSAPGSAIPSHFELGDGSGEGNGTTSFSAAMSPLAGIFASCFAKRHRRQFGRHYVEAETSIAGAVAVQLDYHSLFTRLDAGPDPESLLPPPLSQSDFDPLFGEEDYVHANRQVQQTPICSYVPLEYLPITNATYGIAAGIAPGMSSPSLAGKPGPSPLPSSLGTGSLAASSLHPLSHGAMDGPAATQAAFATMRATYNTGVLICSPEEEKIAIAVARMLLRQGAQVNAVTHSGRTPLHVAAMAGTASMVQLLLDNGALQAKADKHGLTAYDYAKLRLARGDPHGRAILSLLESKYASGWVECLTEAFAPAPSLRRRWMPPCVRGNEAAYHAAIQAGSRALAALLLEPKSKNAGVGHHQGREFSGGDEILYGQDGMDIGDQEAAAQSRAEALPLPPRSQLNEIGVGVLDPAAQALQANLLAVRNGFERWFAENYASISAVLDADRLLDTESSLRCRFVALGMLSLSSWQELAWKKAYSFVGPVWRLGHPSDNDGDVAPLIEAAFQAINPQSPFNYDLVIRADAELRETIGEYDPLNDGSRDDPYNNGDYVNLSRLPSAMDTGMHLGNDSMDVGDGFFSSAVERSHDEHRMYGNDFASGMTFSSDTVQAGDIAHNATKETTRDRHYVYHAHNHEAASLPGEFHYNKSLLIDNGELRDGEGGAGSAAAPVATSLSPVTAVVQAAHAILHHYTHPAPVATSQAPVQAVASVTDLSASMYGGVVYAEEDDGTTPRLTRVMAIPLDD
jgi:hypothetical protein